MKQDNMEDFSEKELKVYSTVIQNEKNELSASLDFIKEILLKEKNSSTALPSSFSELLHKENTKQKIEKSAFNFKNFAVAVGAVAMVALSVKIFFYSDILQEKKKKQFAAKVTFISGDVYLRSPVTKDFVKVENGREIYENQTIVTKEKSIVDIWISVGTSIRIKENSEVNLKKLVQGENNIAELYTEKGKILAHVHKNQKKSNFSILSPTVIAGVRGTRFLFEIEKQTDSIVKVGVEEGMVAVTKSFDGVKIEPSGDQVIEPGQKIEITRNGFKRGLLAEAEKKEILELDSVFIDHVAKKRLTGRATEKQLREEYNKLERIMLDDKTIIRGVIINMTEGSMTIHTTNGEIIIDKAKVVEVDQIF